MPNVKWVICGEDLSELALAGANFSHTDFSGSILSNDLSGVNFSYSYLIGVQLKGVTRAHQLKLCYAHCEYLHAEGVDFKGSDFSQASFAYARVKKANLTGCKRTGVNWEKAQGLNEIVSDTELLQEQKRRHSVLAADVKAQHEQFQALKAQLEAIEKNQHAVDNRLQGQEEKQRDLLLARMAEALQAPGDLKGPSLERWSQVKAYWETRVKACETEGLSALLLMTDYLASQQKHATEPTLQNALQQLTAVWTEGRGVFERTQHSRIQLARRARRLSHFCEAQLRLETECQGEVKTLQRKLDSAGEDSQTVQRLQNRLQRVEADFQSLRTAADWQQSLQQFRDESEAELKALGKEQAEELSRLTGNLCSQCETQFIQQTQRLTSLEKQLRELDAEFSYRIERLETRLDAVDSWMEEAKRTLMTQEAETKDTKGVVQGLKLAVDELQKSRKQQRKQHRRHAQEIADLKRRLAEASDVQQLKVLEKDFKEFKNESKYEGISGASISIDSTPVNQALEALQKELTMQQTTLEQKLKTCRVPSIRNKLEPELEKMKARSQQVTHLQEQLKSSWGDIKRRKPNRC